MRVLVCGGRDYDDRHSLFTILDNYHTENEIKCLIHGDARGADRLAAKWAEDRNIESIAAFPADWEKYGKSAGPVRNQEMLDYGRPDLVIAFPGGKGTADMTYRAEKAGITVHMI